MLNVLLCPVKMVLNASRDSGKVSELYQNYETWLFNKKAVPGNFFLHSDGLNKNLWFAG